jgi:hypothetical protein
MKIQEIRPISPKFGPDSLIHTSAAAALRRRNGTQSVHQPLGLKRLNGDRLNIGHGFAHDFVDKRLGFPLPDPPSSP